MCGLLGVNWRIRLQFRMLSLPSGLVLQCLGGKFHTVERLQARPRQLNRFNPASSEAAPLGAKVSCSLLLPGAGPNVRCFVRFPHVCDSKNIRCIRFSHIRPKKSFSNILVYQGSSGGLVKCLESPDMPSGPVRSHSGDAVLKSLKKSGVSGHAIF